MAIQKRFTCAPLAVTCSHWFLSFSKIIKTLKKCWKSVLNVPLTKTSLIFYSSGNFPELLGELFTNFLWNVYFHATCGKSKKFSSPSGNVIDWGKFEGLNIIKMMWLMSFIFPGMFCFLKTRTLQAHLHLLNCQCAEAYVLCVLDEVLCAGKLQKVAV